ncbi:uncharacterized protein LOC144178264 isoform X1 [Haemaphysalis longicornis]
MRAPLYVVESQATVSSSSNVDVGASTTLARPQGAGTCTRPRLVFLYSALQNSQKIAHPVSSFGGQLLSQSSACVCARVCSPTVLPRVLLLQEQRRLHSNQKAWRKEPGPPVAQPICFAQRGFSMELLLQLRALVRMCC